MMDWFSKELPKGTRIIPLENGFTSDKIAQVFLPHYIDHSDSGPEADWKIMFLDNHGSHCTPEFIALANINHIRPSLIPHLTHCMQRLMFEYFNLINTGMIWQFKMLYWNSMWSIHYSDFLRILLRYVIILSSNVLFEVLLRNQECGLLTLKTAFHCLKLSSCLMLKKSYTIKKKSLLFQSCLIFSQHPQWMLK